MLQSKGYFSFQSEKGEINLRFNIYAYSSFSEKMGMEYVEALNFLAESISVKKFAAFLMSAHESYQLSKGLEVTATEYDSICWIDDLGGFGGKKMMELMNAVSKSNSTEEKEEPKKKTNRQVGKK